MDFQNRAGSKFGGGGLAGRAETNADRRERLRKLALETIDLDKDPFWFRNHLGHYECKLCLTSHVNDGSYLAHTQGRKHQTNLARRAAMDAKNGRMSGVGQMGLQPQQQQQQQVRKSVIKIGRPGYRITKCRDPVSRQVGLLFQLQYPEISQSVHPQHRFMGAFEQRKEAPDKALQYLLIAAEPYETVAFRLQAREMDTSPGRFWTHWDPDAREFFLQLFYRAQRQTQTPSMVPGYK